MKLLELDLDVYQGPFDLLFTLILKEEVDVCEIKLAEVILAYLEGLSSGEGPDWEGLSEFLVLISALLELKSRLLLPGVVTPGEELDPEQARDLLLDKLITHRTYKEAGLALSERFLENRGRYPRPPERPKTKTSPPLEQLAGSQKPSHLKETMERLLQGREGPDTSHICSVRVDLRRQIAAIRAILGRRGRFSFEDAFGREEAMTQAVSLFALLEMLAQGAIRVSQARPFADITVLVREARQVA